ncbi:MAG: type II secretion system F family protein [Phycisphaerales bacterium]|nr:type II secretion system F family protein [Phycisphaerales bacterium]
MPMFQYEALNAAGQKVTSEIDAVSADEAISKIRSQGYFTTKVKEKAVKKPKGAAGGAGAAAAAGPKKKSLNFNISIGGVSNKVITQFTRQLSTLQDAGLPILRSLKILWQQQKPGPLKTILDQVANDVESGSTLSDSMSRHPKAFDRLYTNMVQAGEAGGVLDVILQRLADFMEKAQRLKRRVIGAMIYPACVITFAVIIVTGIMIVVVPKFKDIFRDFGTTLPQLTVYLIAFSDWVANYGWLWILCSPFIVFFGIKLIGKSRIGRQIIDTVKLKIPIIGQILAKTSIARFTRTLGTLLSAGVPILDALNITRDTVGNTVYEKALQKVHDAIREGESFAAPLRQAKVCDSIVTNMIDVGEETGDLDKMLIKIADNYDEEVDVLVGSLVSLLEPIMVVGLGLIVGTIVIALFLPLVKLITSLSSDSNKG